jgi:hypothetical protein
VSKHIINVRKAMYAELEVGQVRKVNPGYYSRRAKSDKVQGNAALLAMVLTCIR